MGGDIEMSDDLAANNFVRLPWHDAAIDGWLTSQRRAQNGHAYLLTHECPEEARLFAARLSAVLVCAEFEASEPCGVCRGCRLREQSAHGDLLVVEKEEGKSAISIDQIRTASRFLQQTALFGTHKIIVINDAEGMTQAAANSLLKTLEEPAGDSVLLLTSSMPWRLPATVRSRCQLLRLAAASRDVALSWLLSQGVSQADANTGLGCFPGRPTEALAALTGDYVASVTAIDASFAMLEQFHNGPHLPPNEWLNQEPAEVMTRLLAVVEARLGAMGASALRRGGRDWLLLHKCVGELLSRLHSGAHPARDILLGQLALLCGQCGQPRFADTAHEFLEVLGRPGFSG